MIILIDATIGIVDTMITIVDTTTRNVNATDKFIEGIVSNHSHILL